MSFQPARFNWPGKPLIQNAADDGGHETRLRSGSLVAADALSPLKFDLVGGIVVEIFSVGNFVGAKRIDELVVLALEGKIVALNLHTGGKRLQVDGNLRGQIFFQALVHDVERDANGDGGNGDADK